jgi:hypothetical protein
MADILHMPPRPPRKGRPRNRPIEGAPLAQLIDGVDFREANKPTYAEIQADLNRVAHYLLRAMRSADRIFPAYPD